VHGGNLAWAAEIAGCSPNSLLDFSASINPLGPPASVLAAIQGAIAKLRHYPDPQYGELRAALADYHGLAADWLLPGNGAAELLTWAARDLSLAANSSPAVACVVTPAFRDYHRAFSSFGVKLLPWPLLPFQKPGMGLNSTDFFALGWPDPEPSATGSLINNPHNPTGHLFAAQELLPLLERFSLVVVDEAFMDFLPPSQSQSLIPWVTTCPNLVIVRSLTKFYTLPGLRIGYAIGHPDRLRRWQQWRDPWPVNELAVAAAMAAVGDSEFQARTWQWLPPTRQALRDGIEALPGLHPLPGAANYLLVKAEQSVLPLQERLLKQHRVLIRDCLSFGELGDRYLRVAVRTNFENERFLTALQSCWPYDTE